MKIRNPTPVNIEHRLDVEEKTKSKSRWFTLEYFVWLALVIGGYIYMAYLCILRSEELKRNTPRVVPGWFMGRYMDLSDNQWAMWRKNLPLLAIGLSVFVYLSHLVKKLRKYNKVDYSPSILYYNVVAILAMFCIIFRLPTYCTDIHGFDIIILYTVSYLNYCIAKLFKGSKWNPTLCWAFNIVVIFSADYFQGYKGLFTYLGFPLLESYKGVLVWSTYYKMGLLRHISFNMDYYWMCSNKPLPENLNQRSAYTQAEETHHPASHYGLAEYFAYIYYIPLFLAGPAITFNAFMAQVITPQTTYTFKQLIVEMIKVVIYTVGLEIYLHFFYQYAFCRFNFWNTPKFSPLEVCLVAYWTLNFMYTKFLIIWRFFRVVALFDGIDTPENMNRCVNNNFTFAGFWRSWHGSLNKWIVRYLYVPLGGSKTQAISMWLIFSFIGLWHDLLTSWLAWALCNCVFFSLEILIVQLFSSNKFAWLWSKWYWRYIVGVAGVIDILMLKLANIAILHGFTNTPVFLYKAFFVPGGFTAFLAVSGWLFCVVMIMLEIRESEKRSNNAKRF